jgi:oxygen-independent coproporphyrinogen-3 oxidase
MKQFSEIDLSILKRYDKPGPRYTSYPTAPLFKKDFGPAEFEAEILRTNSPENDTPLSLYFHIPFCESLCYFCGCNMLVTHDRTKISEYLNFLEKEMNLVANHLNPHRKVTQIHWGGGTPTYLNPDEIADLSSSIRQKFSYAEEIEAGCEIDPRGLMREHLVALKKGGFNRLSMGVQDFNERVQKAVNRIQPETMTRQVVDWSRELGFKSINLDLIYGLPFQTPKTFEETLDHVIAISPDRFAVFNYAHVPWLKKHMSLIKEKDLPTPDQKLTILKMTIEKLSDAGYWYIGMDHFAKPEDELAIAQKNKTLRRNFQGYSTKAGCDVYAMGVSAISQFKGVYAQNAKTLPEYYRAISESQFATHVGYRLNQDDQIRQKVITRLMCDFELDEVEIEKEFGLQFEEYFSNSLTRLSDFVQDGFVELRDRKIFVKGMGRLLIRNIAMVFDAYLDVMMKERPVFSKTI